MHITTETKKGSRRGEEKREGTAPPDWPGATSPQNRFCRILLSHTLSCFRSLLRQALRKGRWSTAQKLAALTGAGGAQEGSEEAAPAAAAVSLRDVRSFLRPLFHRCIHRSSVVLRVCRCFDFFKPWVACVFVVGAAYAAADVTLPRKIHMSPLVSGPLPLVSFPYSSGAVCLVNQGGNGRVHPRKLLGSRCRGHLGRH